MVPVGLEMSLGAAASLATGRATRAKDSGRGRHHATSTALTAGQSRAPAGSAIIGTICGLAGGIYASRFIETMLFEVTTRDVRSLALPFGTLLLAALAAAAIPAWRAARVDPVVALRND